MTLDELYKLAQVVAWIATAAAASFGVYKYFPEARERRLWEKAKLAKGMIDDLSQNTKALDASYMLGAFRDRRYERTERGEVTDFRVSAEQVRSVLNPSREPLSDNERYVRECFDDFLWHLDHCAAVEEAGVVDWKDLQPMFLNLFAGVERSTGDTLRLYALHLRYFRAASRIPELVEATLTTPNE